jgi:hypothetical protein
MAELPTNNQEELEKIEAEKDAAFRAEIERLKEAEESGEKTTAHLRPGSQGAIDISKLTREDRKMWEKVESGTPFEGEFHGEFDEYTASVNGEAAEEKKKMENPSALTSRQIFRAYLGNRIMIVPYEMAKKKKEQEKKNP